MYLYDAAGRELARFKDLRYAPLGAFQPGTNRFLLRSTAGRIAVYDCDERKLLKKFDFSTVHFAQDDGFCFAPDGKYFYNIERFPVDIKTRLRVYETESFTPVRELGEKNLSEILYDESRDRVQLLYFTRSADGCFDQGYVGTLEGETIAMLRRLSEEEYEFLRGWLSLRNSGITEKAMEWSALHYDAYTNDQLQTLRDRELDLETFDLTRVLEDLQEID